jgi:hypothetical protein
VADGGSPDRGEADPALRSLLSEAGSGDEHYLRAVAALCGARLLMPIVAVGADGTESGSPDQMRTLLLSTSSGRSAIPVFTGLDTFSAWRADARPLPCRLDEVAATAVEAGAAAVLVDFEGPAGMVLEASLFTELAAGKRLVALDDGGWGWLYADSSGTGSDSSAETSTG